VGDVVKLSEADFVRLSKAFFAAIKHAHSANVSREMSLANEIITA
jgi:hypothetical protein